ncbi:ABC Superfamily [Phytophthora palmivora]|uniref:ABC Superfamily n=1 Tax=Phytophthora palmivora TaxID=4796 RepID=A0A2P4XEB1_9STRA|nr:ABC Superfamily [Phytophthora palmivora]
MITGSESDEDTTGSTKDPAPTQDTPSQDAPVDDFESSEAKAASTTSPAKNLTLDEGKARSQAAKAAPQKRADDGAAAAKKRAAPDSPSRESGLPKGYHSLFDSSSDDGEEEGAITESQEISNELDEQQERYQAAQLQGASEVASSAPPTPVYPCGYYPPDVGSGSPMFLEHLKAPRGLNHGRTSHGACVRASVQASHAFEYEAPSQPYPSGPSTSGRDSMGSLLSDEVRQLRDRVYAIEIALGLGPGGQAASQASKSGALEALRRPWAWTRWSGCLSG